MKTFIRAAENKQRGRQFDMPGLDAIEFRKFLLVYESVNLENENYN